MRRLPNLVASAVLVALVATVAAVGLPMTGAAAATHAAAVPDATATKPVGVTKTTVSVAGIVGADPLSTGAEIGAQARLARANRTKELHGLTVEYLRTEPAADSVAADAAATRLAAEAFAVVPAIGPWVGAPTLAHAGVPFFGSASTAEWYANRTGFGFTGVAITERTRIADSPLGMLLRDTLGGVDAPVAVVYDDDPAGLVHATHVRRSLRAAGFRTVDVVAVPLLPAPYDTAALAARPANGVNVFLTSTARTVDLVGRLVTAASTATMVVGPEFYAPTAPVLANGLTVLTAVAPFEEATVANRRLAADVEAFAPGTVVTPAIAAGYWSADLFLRGMSATGKHPTRAGLLDALNSAHFTYAVAGTVGRSTWPEMHTQPVPCGSLSQSDGTQFVVVAPYGCAPARRR